jgi:hypothetical protein
MNNRQNKHNAKVGGAESYVSSSGHAAQWSPEGLEDNITSDNIVVSTNHSRNPGMVTFALHTEVPRARPDKNYSPDHFMNTTRYSLGHGVVYPDGSMDKMPHPKWTHDPGFMDERAIKHILSNHFNSVITHPRTGVQMTVAQYHGLQSPIQEDLRRWFKEKWTAQDGSECGDYKGKGRVKCRPSRRVSEKSPQTWSEMSPEEKKKAVRKKQEAHRKGKQWSSHKTGKTWDGPKNKYKPGKKKMNESYLIEDDVIGTGENPAEYRKRLLARIQSGDISGMDNHDRVHGALAYIDSVKDQYQGRDRNIVLNVNGVGTDGGAKIGFIVHGVHPKGKHLMVQPAAKGAASHPKLEELPIKNIYGLQMSAYPNMKTEHRDVLRRLMDFRGLREMKEQIKQLFLERRQNKDCGCNQIQEEKEKKPYKGFKKGKNHPEGGLSRSEAKRQGIHAGIETKDEAKRKGGFNKLSKKTQKRRKSFCARMCGMKRRRTSSKTARDPKSKINAALRVWGCRCGTNESFEPIKNVIMEKRGSCWEGYKQQGMKKKNGRMVPNCVPMNESLITEENIPTKPKLWSRAKALARKKFKVYPSAYANAWASRWYKKHGGRWKKSKKNIKESFIQKILSLKEKVENPSNKGTMTKKQIRSRDKRAKTGNFSKYRPIKGDTEKEMKYRISTFIELRKRGKKGEKKSKKEKQED